MGMGQYIYCKANREVRTGVQVGGGGQVMENGRNTGVTAGQGGVAGSEMTKESVYCKGREQIEIVELESG